MQRCAKTNEVLFATILSHCQPAEPLALWEHFKDDLCQDLLHEARRQTDTRNFKITVEQDGLRHIQKLLHRCGVSLKKFHLPEPPAVDADAEYQVAS